MLKITDTTTSQFFDTWGLLLTFVLGFGIYTAATRFAKPSLVRHGPPRNDPALEVDDPREARVRCHSCDMSYLAREMDRDPSAGHQAICAECATSRPSTARRAWRPRRSLTAGSPASRRGGAGMTANGGVTLSTFDLNCDMGESLGNWVMGSDEEIMPHITTANVAVRLPRRRPGDHGAGPWRWRSATASRSARIPGSPTCSASAGGGWSSRQRTRPRT